MSKIAIWEGLGRKRRKSSKRRGHRRSIRGLGVSPKAKPGYKWHQSKKGKRGNTPKQQAVRRVFKAAAKACKVEFKRKGGPVQRRRAYTNCIKIYMNKHV